MELANPLALMQMKICAHVAGCLHGLHRTPWVTVRGQQSDALTLCTDPSRAGAPTQNSPIDALCVKHA